MNLLSRAREQAVLSDFRHRLLNASLLIHSCYTDPGLKNVTLHPEVALGARRKAADENTSVSKLVSRLLEKEMRSSDSYWRAYEEWKRLPDNLGAPEPIDASKRMTRDEVHERR